jgi:hypothetical protein
LLCRASSSKIFYGFPVYVSEDEQRVCVGIDEYPWFEGESPPSPEDIQAVVDIVVRELADGGIQFDQDSLKLKWYRGPYRFSEICNRLSIGRDVATFFSSVTLEFDLILPVYYRPWFSQHDWSESHIMKPTSYKPTTITFTRESCQGSLPLSPTFVIQKGYYASKERLQWMHLVLHNTSGGRK